MLVPFIRVLGDGVRSGHKDEDGKNGLHDITERREIWWKYCGVVSEEDPCAETKDLELAYEYPAISAM
nr:hypothetical protein CFP56_58148 [Quercus suber]